MDLNVLQTLVVRVENLPLTASLPRKPHVLAERNIADAEDVLGQVFNVTPLALVTLCIVSSVNAIRPFPMAPNAPLVSAKT